MREHGYSNFDTTLVDSNSEYHQFLARIASQEHWNDKTAFTSVIDTTSINFDTQNLIFYRITEGSGSITLTPQTPKVQNSELIIEIKRDVPDMGTADMAYYCLAYVVDKNISTITFNVGDKSESIPTAIPTVCTMEYAPVCGLKNVQCVTTPCNPIVQTYSNACMLNADEATSLFSGECPNGEIPKNCSSWYDGCNNCFKDEQGNIACTEMYCEVPNGPIKCLD